MSHPRRLQPRLHEVAGEAQVWREGTPPPWPCERSGRCEASRNSCCRRPPRESMPNISRWHHSARPTMRAPTTTATNIRGRRHPRSCTPHAALPPRALEPGHLRLQNRREIDRAHRHAQRPQLSPRRPCRTGRRGPRRRRRRLRLLLNTFDTLAASDTVVALQEVPLGWLSALRRHARKLGYRLVATFSKLARGVPGFMGVALAWPARAYDATAVDARQLHEAVGWPRQPSPPRDAAWTNVRGAVSAVVAARLRQRGGAGAAFVAASVHLPYDGRLGALLRPTQGVAAAIAARHVAALANRSGAALPHALAGDFNAPPGTTAHSVMLGQESPPQPARSVAWWPPAAPRRYRSAYAAAAGAEPPFTNVVASRGGGAPATLTLDYVWDLRRVARRRRRSAAARRRRRGAPQPHVALRPPAARRRARAAAGPGAAAAHGAQNSPPPPRAAARARPLGVRGRRGRCGGGGSGARDVARGAAAAVRRPRL